MDCLNGTFNGKWTEYGNGFLELLTLRHTHKILACKPPENQTQMNSINYHKFGYSSTISHNSNIFESNRRLGNSAKPTNDDTPAPRQAGSDRQDRADKPCLQKHPIRATSAHASEHRSNLRKWHDQDGFGVPTLPTFANFCFRNRQSAGRIAVPCSEIRRAVPHNLLADPNIPATAKGTHKVYMHLRWMHPSGR